MEELVGIIEYVPEKLRAPLILIIVLAPRIIQKIKAPDMKFLGALSKLPEFLKTAQTQRNEILVMLEDVNYDVHEIRKILRDFVEGRKAKAKDNVEILEED